MRGRFADDHVPPGVLDGLALAAEQQGGALRVVRPDELVDVSVLVAKAEQYLEGDAAYASELATWSGVPEGRLDGVPEAALDTEPDRAELVVGRRFHPERPVGVLPTLPVPEHPALALVVSPGDTLVDRLQAGMTLSRVLLEATAAGLAAQPLGQVTDVPATRLALAHALGLSSVPQLLLRLGQARPRRVAPRRPVSDVLD